MRAEDATQAQPAKGAARRGLGVVWLLFAALCAAFTAGQIGAWHWVFDLCAHFRVQYAYTAALFLGLFVVYRDLRGVLAVVVLAVFLLPGLFRLAWRMEHDPSAEARAPLRILLANVHTSNRAHEVLVEAVQREAPDIVVLQETDEAWIAGIEPLMASYPHRIVEPRADNFGMTLLARMPLETAECRFIAGPLPTLVARFVHEAKTWTVFATHALPPRWRNGTARRDQQLIEVAQLAREAGERCLVVGDFNTTPWSHIFERMLEVGDLVDSAKGFGVQPTWPMRLPGILRIPLDHCLCSRDVLVKQRRLVGAIGSDHMPVFFELR